MVHLDRFILIRYSSYLYLLYLQYVYVRIKKGSSLSIAVSEIQPILGRKSNFVKNLVFSIMFATNPPLSRGSYVEF